MIAKKRDELSLFDVLSQLHYLEACKLLGAEGPKLLRSQPLEHIDLKRQVRLREDRFELTLVDACASVHFDRSRRHQLRLECSSCDPPCSHLGVTFSLILEEKFALGLSKEPLEEMPTELLPERALIQRAFKERAERAREEPMRLESADPEVLWTDYTILNKASGRSYRVALRGTKPGESYCSCPDFRTNGLGTCKHLIQALHKLRARFPAAEFRKPYRRRRISVFLRYGDDVTIHLGLPARLSPRVEILVKRYRDRPITPVAPLIRTLRKIESLGEEVSIHPDAQEYLERRAFAERVEDQVAEIRAAPEKHPLRTSLLKIPLLPYQLEGVAFAVGAGRSILADDMGLGKTIQAIGVVELLQRTAGIKKVLIVCPASVKSQWKSEIERFSGRSVQIVTGTLEERPGQYANECLFTVCNYEQVLRDLPSVERTTWDLIVLDEGQRIKNWQAATSRTIKGLRSPFALVLSGTPLENNLEELYSVLQFIDDRRLGPMFRFMHRHRIVDPKGKMLGYKNLAKLRELLSPVLLRRTREAVLRDLPTRSTEILRVEPTDWQQKMHGGFMQTVMQILRKNFLTEMDLLRLQKALLAARMVSDSTTLVDKKVPGHSSKLELLETLLVRLCKTERRKTLLFSEWTTMLDLIETILERQGIAWVRLDGSVPQRKRAERVQRFREDPSLPLFLCTNAGSTGLNLQVADTVVNVDLPWNPAVLEQRIGRAHRMGQKRKVQVYLLVTSTLIEERLLQTLASKKELAQAALDPDSTVDYVEKQGGMEDLRRKLEILLGDMPEAPERKPVPQPVRPSDAAASAIELLARFLDSVQPADAKVQRTLPALHTNIRRQLESRITRDERGQPQLVLPLSGTNGIDRLAQLLAAALSLPHGADRSARAATA